MSGFRVNSVVIVGKQLIGGMRQSAKGHQPTIAQLKRMGVGVKYHVEHPEKGEGVIAGRLDDWAGVPLQPSLHPGNFSEIFVGETVLAHAQEVIAREPAMQARFQNQGYLYETALLDNLRFALTPTDAMFFAQTQVNPDGSLAQPWPQTDLVPFGEFEITPAASALNYGQGIFEGMKAQRTVDGKIIIFRPRDNALRAQAGAERLLLGQVPEDYFLDAVTRVVLKNERWIPEVGNGALYIRPLLLGTGGVVGVNPAPKNAFIVFVTPVGPYFQGGLTAIDLAVARSFHRAAPGGVGHVKAIGNYAPGIRPAKMAKAMTVPGKDGVHFAEVMYLSTDNVWMEEVGAANFFGIWEDVLWTPKSPSILPGITRHSVTKIGKQLGMSVLIQPLHLQFVLDKMTGAFCTGTAAVISPIGSITTKAGTPDEAIKVFGDGNPHPKAVAIYNILTAMQEGRFDDAIAEFNRSAVPGKKLEMTPEEWVARYRDEWIHVIKEAA